MTYILSLYLKVELTSGIAKAASTLLCSTWKSWTSDFLGLGWNSQGTSANKKQTQKIFLARSSHCPVFGCENKEVGGGGWYTWSRANQCLQRWRGGGIRRIVIRPFLVMSVCELESETCAKQKRAPLIDQNEEYTHKMHSPVRGLSHCLSSKQWTVGRLIATTYCYNSYLVYAVLSI